MSTQSSVPSASWPQSNGFGTAITAALRPLYWSIRRELWENRSIYIAPTAAAAIFLIGFMISIVRTRLHLPRIAFAINHGSDQYNLSSALVMGTALIVGIFYCLDALYGERRDRSILFWKSLPVSDLTAVLAKLAIPILILPLLSFVISAVTQFIMLVMSSAVFAGTGVSLAAMWADASYIRVPLVWLYHLFTVHGLWYAPIYAWLLLVSAWAPRAPFMWAFLPPFVVWGVEKIAFNTSYFLDILKYRFTGPQGGMAPANDAHDFTSSLIPHHFFTTPGLWTGLALAAIFLFATVQLRRSRGPI